MYGIIKLKKGFVSAQAFNANMDCMHKYDIIVKDALNYVNRAMKVLGEEEEIFVVKVKAKNPFVV
jgi:hypothetical protein